MVVMMFGYFESRLYLLKALAIFMSDVDGGWQGVAQIYTLDGLQIEFHRRDPIENNNISNLL